MKKTFILVITVLCSVSLYAQRMEAYDFSLSDKESFSFDTADKSSFSQRSNVRNGNEARKNDYFMALVPGAVQLRRGWPAVAATVWGGMAISGGLAIYEQIHIVNLQHQAENDPTSANWYDEQIRKSEKIRNGSLFALGGVYIANYISAVLLKDKSQKSGFLGFYADPQGAVGLSYAFNF